MARMVRKQLNIEYELDRALAEQAEKLGISQSELVRQALERFLTESDEERRRAHVQRLREMWTDSDDRRGTSGSADDGWTREEIHERRRRR
ncbi:MAG: ribbon-helix-helix protein, CopG family [Anaerosomatales bacterium]|nr:ribbon-helix-helix protein, CopG family [Anaerosomatales bacterium]